MKILTTLFVTAMLGLIGCSSTQAAAPDLNAISPEFTKAAKVAYSLIDQASLGHPVLQSDVSRSLAETKAASSSVREAQVLTALELARTHLQDVRYDASELTRAFACKDAAGDVLNGYGADMFTADYQACIKPVTHRKK